MRFDNGDAGRSAHRRTAAGTSLARITARCSHVCYRRLWRDGDLCRGRSAATRSPNSGMRPPRGIARIHKETFVPASLDETFAFFSDAANLEFLTPHWLNFRILTPLPIPMREGAEIRYRIVLYGIPIPWTTRIEVWEPGVRFVDRQTSGPYRWWRHEHRFETVPSGTRVVDVVEYVPRLRWLTQWKVGRDVERIFAYRADALKQRFATAERLTHTRQIRVVRQT